LPGDYRIHGTDIDKIFGIGMQITHGCVRMYPEDISALYQSVSVGTSVYIVKQPVKVGWLNNVLYVEAHPDLEGEEKTQDERYAIALSLIKQENNQELPDFDQVVLNKVLKDLDGTPTPVYERLPPLEGEVVAPIAKAVPVIKEVSVASVANKKPVAANKGKLKDSTVNAKKTKVATLQTASNAKKTPAKESAKATKSQKPVTKTTGNNDSTGSVGGYFHGN
jgi:L,D-transpeptidase ErfK/SrfK